MARLSPCQCLDAGLGNLSFGDIQRRAHHAHRPPLSVANDEAAVLCLRIATVTAVKMVLVGPVVLLALDRREDAVHHALAIVRVDALGPWYLPRTGRAFTDR